MGKMFYCSNCKRLSVNEEKCDYCSDSSMFVLKVGAPVSVIDHKLKGKILKINEDTLRVLIFEEGNNRSIKEYKAKDLKKVI